MVQTSVEFVIVTSTNVPFLYIKKKNKVISF